MAYDEQSNRVILFGGQHRFLDPYNGTWAFDPIANGWTELKPTHPPSGSGPMAYDAQSDRIILYIGAVEDASAQPYQIVQKGQTWAFDFETNSWSNLHPAVGPFGLLGPGMAYDAESDRMILFGGADPSKLALTWFLDTWSYDFESNTWTKMAPLISPPGRNFQMMAYDSAADRVILWGGRNDQDVWAYDYNTDTWAALETTGGPTPLDYGAMVYLPQTMRMFLFGGVSDSDEIPTESSWIFEYTTGTWKPLTPASPPSARGWHAMSYATATDQVVLFGGGRNRDNNTDETWIYDPTANTWTEVAMRP